MKEKFMKNGVFSLEYDKETLKDMVLELQEKNHKQKEVIDKAIELLNSPWSFESGNEKVDNITYNKKREVIYILKGDSNG